MATHKLRSMDKHTDSALLDPLSATSGELADIAGLTLDFDPDLPDELKELSMADEYLAHQDVVHRARLAAIANQAVGNMDEHKRLSDKVRASATFCAMIKRNNPQVPALAKKIGAIRAAEQMKNITAMYLALDD